MAGVIWLASYPKSGNTWLRAFLHNLLRNPPQPADINELDKFCLGESSTVWYAQAADRPVTELSLEEIAALRPRVQQAFTTVSPDSVFAKTHNWLGEWFGQPLHNMEVTAGAIYVVRNPLDVVISFSHHYGFTLDEAIGVMNDPAASTGLDERHVPEVLNTWSMHVTSWTAQPSQGLHVMRYEDMLEKPIKTFNALAAFLGLKPPRDRLQRAINFSSFKVLKKQETEKDFKERSEHADSFFRAGKSGQWRNVLSKDQVARLVDDHREVMDRFKYIPAGY